MRLFVPMALATIVLPACQPDAGPPDPAPTAPASAASGAAPPPSAESRVSLAGEYRVAGVDGQDVNLPHAITVSVTGTVIRYASQCVGGMWSYRQDGNAIELERIPTEACERSLYPEEAAIETVFANSATVSRTASNGLQVEGGGHSLTLFSQ